MIKVYIFNKINDISREEFKTHLAAVRPFCGVTAHVTV